MLSIIYSYYFKKMYVIFPYETEFKNHYDQWKRKNCFSTIKSDMTSSAVEYQMFQSSKNMKEFSQITKIKFWMKFCTIKWMYYWYSLNFNKVSIFRNYTYISSTYLLHKYNTKKTPYIEWQDIIGNSFAKFV